MSSSCIEDLSIQDNQWYRIANEMLGMADIQVNGSRPFDIKVKNPDFFKRVLQEGSLGPVKVTWTAGGNVNDWIFSSSAFSMPVSKASSRDILKTHSALPPHG